MKGEGRLDATLDRTAREAVEALSRELSGPVASEVGKEVRAHIDPVTVLIRTETSKLTRAADAVREAVDGIEAELVNTLQETVADVGTQATERMIGGATSALGDQIRGTYETLDSAVGRVRDEAKNSLNEGLRRLAGIDALLNALDEKGKNATAAQASAATQLTSRLEALKTALAAQHTVVDQAARSGVSIAGKVQTLHDALLEHRALTEQTAKRLDCIEQTVGELRQAQAASERQATERAQRAQGQLQDLFVAAEQGHVRRVRLLAGGIAVLCALTIGLFYKVILSS